MHKKLLSVLLILFIVSAATGCGTGKSGSVPENGVVIDGFTVKTGDSIEAVKEHFGEPSGYTESLSCLYDGFDKSFVYDGFEIITFPDKDRDFISSVMISSSSIETADGFGPGSSIDDVIAAYAEDDLRINDYCVIRESADFGICHYYDKSTRKIDRTEIYLIDE